MIDTSRARPSGTGSRADASSPSVSTKGFDPAREEAARICEQFINQVLLRRSVEETLVGLGAWQRLTATPVCSIDSVGEIAPGAYAVDIDSSGDGWVRVASDAPVDHVVVRYTAGLATKVGDIPAPLLGGIDRLAAHLANDPDGEPPAVVTALWRPYRRLRLS